MKTSNKSSLIAGISLLVIAAFFSITLILQPLGFGITEPGQNNILYLLGNMLYSVYGFSSILIPAFLLIAGLSCFTTQWTARKTMRLLTALVPFFTCVVTENVCRSIIALGKGPFSGVKISVAIITGIMLVVIEWLGIGIVADRLNRNSQGQRLSKLKQVPSSKSGRKPSIIEEVLSRIAPKSEEADEKAGESESDDNAPAQNSAEPAGNAEKNPAENAADDSTPTAPLLTQEEYAVLTDDLTWNIPPAPATLPPEYDADFDENDPALEFPPKDEVSEKNAETPADDSDVAEPEDDIAPEFDVDFADDDEPDEDDGQPAEEDSDDADEPEEQPGEKKNPDDEFESPYYESDIKSGSGEAENPRKTDETPYSAARYIDSVVENPKFPHGIVIHDEVEQSDEEEPDSAAPQKPKFPSKIMIQDGPEYDEDFDDEYVEDETLPFPDFDIEEPAFRHEPPQPQIPAAHYEPAPAPQPVAIAVAEPVAQTIPVQTELHGAVFAAAASNAFAQMEEEIRQSQALNPPQIAQSAPQNFEQYDDETDFDDETEAENRNEAGATNLTADELSDFFNAQQEENTPRTTEIAGNPPKIGNRAAKKGPYIIPSDLLTAYKDDQYWVIDDATKQAALSLKQTLAEFNIEADIIGIKKGPVVTMFEILPAPGVKLSKIVALQDNIALSLAAQSVRIVAPIPGKQAVGIEVPNRHRSVVGFREIIEMDLPEWQKMAVPVVLGKDILGKAQLIDLVKTPHMLIAGATGSGKSVCVNSLILSILYKRSFRDVKLILVDPKVVELKLYNNIPHLLTPVITEPKKALQALQYCLCEMERRYALLDGMGVRDISNYNQKISEQNIATERLPYIVVIIDEFADLMATSGKELESIVARLTAMSRAVGIHLVLATQRPSVNVITGLIKANIPTRIAFMVASRTDSNIIIDTVGAEKLLGRGDMLYASAVDPAPIRIQGTFVSDQEVEDVVEAVKEYGEPDYIDDEIFIEDDEDDSRDLFGEPADGDDPLYDQALEIVVQSGKASASYIQRRLKIGYNRAARLVEEMEERGIVGPANGSKPREIIHMP